MKSQLLIDMGEKVWDTLSPFAPPGALDLAGRAFARCLFRYSDSKMERYLRETGDQAIPPAPLRYRVWGDPDIRTFLSSGAHCREDIIHALRRVGREIKDFHRILDFGCGCGRILRFLTDDLHPSSRAYGTDIDEEAITWCSRTYDHEFQVNRHHPPLSYSSDSFDCILAIAVFRHFNEEDQFLWLKELKRVLKPKGILLLSLHGRFCWKDFPPPEVSILQSRGFLFKPLKDPYHRSVFPQWYQAAYHSREYVMENYARHLDLLEYIPRGVENETDMIVLQKPSE